MASGVKGSRELETLCTVCQTVVGVKEHLRSQQSAGYRVARHAVPGSTRNQVMGRRTRLPICTGSGISVPDAVIIPTKVSI